MVKRSPTLKHVSQQLRKASVRVANIMAVENDGMVRLPDEETTGAPQPRVNGSQPPETGLRGRTLGVFTSHSSVRRTADKLLRRPFTEPAILALIIANVVILAIQSASPLNEPKVASGYFQSWEDTVLLALFATTDQNQEGNAESFDNIFAALLQVIVLASINTWSGLMYTAMDTDYFSSSLYFLSAVIVLNFWLMNLLVAVVVNTFKDIRAETKRSAFGAEINPSWATASKRQGGTLLQMYNKTRWFWTLLVLADLVAQACKTSHSSETTITLLRNLELTATIAFDFEIFLRIVAHWPDWSVFFRVGRNDFDLFLAITTSIIQIPTISGASVYPWLTVFQLLRWYRVILAFPRMRPLLMTVFGGFAGLFNMVVFLFLMNFLGALMAVQLLRGDIAVGDTITFSQIYNSFLGMYQLFSSENWTTVLYAAMDAEFAWQQGWLVAVFLCAWFIFANFVMLQMFVAVINENFAVAEEQKRKQQIEAFIRRTEPESARVSWVERLNPYRLIKAQHKAVHVGALPLSLLLPLKQTVGVDVGTPQVTTEGGAKGAMRRLFGFDSKETAIPLRRLRPRSTRVEDLDDFEDDRGLTDLLPPLMAGPSADEHMDAIRERRNQQADFIAAHPSYDCTMSTVVKVLLFVVVVASIAVAAVATPLYRKNYYDKHGMNRGTWFDLAEVGLGMVFVIEAAIKIVADGFIFAPNAYLLSLWNVLDFGILITLLVNTTTSLIFIGGLSRTTRALKAFRALRLITLFSRLRDTFHAVLFAGALRILDASVLMILYIIPFAVWGLNIFSGLLFYCNDGDVSGKTTCINEYSVSPVDDSLSFLAPKVWANPTIANSSSNWAFDSFRQSILILFEIVSLEGWIDVMGSVMTIVGRDQQPQDGASQWNAIFFVVFNLFGGVIILTLFVSIIIENFSMRSGNALLTTEQRHWVDLRKFIKRQTPSQLPKRKPPSPVRAWCYDRAVDKAGWWSRAFTGLYYIHILFLMFEDYSSNIVTDTQFNWIFLCLTFVYAVDLLVRFFGLGFTSFRSNGWNLFDAVVITGSFATTAPALLASMQNSAGNQVVLQLQKLFLVSIALKLVQRVDSLNQLFKTSVASLPAIGNLFLLWATLFIFFAILFIEIFGLTKIGNNAGTRFQNYYSFGNSLIMLSFMSTGYIFLNMFTGVVVESFAYVYQMPGAASLNREEIRSFKKLWSEFDSERSGYIKRKDFVRFFSRLSGAFEVRIYPPEHSIGNIIRGSIPDPVANASGQLLVASGVRRAVDVRHVEAHIRQIDFREVRRRRHLYARLFNEARISEEPGRGISFTAMLMMLAHYKLIDDEKALLLDDLLVRRAKTERVTDLVNLDRVRGLLRTIYWRRRFLAARDEKRRTLALHAEGIPAIVLEPTPLTPPTLINASPAVSLESADQRSTQGHSPALSPSPQGPVLSRHVSNSSMLSSEDAHRREPVQESVMDEPVDDSVGVWGDMLREAMEDEGDDG
ncbi:calcium channel protein [Cryptotrichosporon argae]